MPELSPRKRQALRTIGREIGRTITQAEQQPEVFAHKMRERAAAMQAMQDIKESDKPLEQPVYDPIDLFIDIATGGGTILGRIVESVVAGGAMTGVDMAGGGALAQMAGAVGGHGALQASRTALVKSRFISTLAKKIDEVGGRPLLNEAGKITFHGTPHKFPPTENNPLGEFDLSKIGTGEGAQAYGHGIYLAESEGVAKSYRDDLSLGRIDDYKKISEIVWDSGDWFSDPEKYSRIDLDSVIDALNLTTAHLGDVATDQDVDAFAAKILDSLENMGSLYKVDLPDEHIDKMLDWDKPLSDEVKQRISPLIDQAKRSYPGLRVDEMTGGDFYRAYTGHRGGNQDVASEAFKGLGIPGIKYHDAMSRGAEGGTRNFVLFDPDIAKIVDVE